MSKPTLKPQPSSFPKELVKVAGLGLADRSGLYVPYSAAEAEVVRTERSIRFDGHAPSAGNGSHVQQAIGYARKRRALSILTDIYYDEAGMAWSGRTLLRAASIRQPSLKEVYGGATVRRGDRQLARGFVLEASTPVTYGDWFAGPLRMIVNLPDGTIDAPIVLPAFMRAKPYVLRDLTSLGHEVAAAGCRISDCRVIREMEPRYELGETDLANFRAAFNIDPPTPRAGSLLYLARYDTTFEINKRVYPSEAMARIVEAEGGRVFDTRQADPDSLAALADDAETVVADQGSAMFGLTYWRSKAVLELTLDDWWNSANVFLARATGVDRYRVAVVDDAGPEDLAAELAAIRR